MGLANSISALPFKDMFHIGTGMTIEWSGMTKYSDPGFGLE